MIDVLGCLFRQHDMRLVVLAVLLCGMACVTALNMLMRARAADPGQARLYWLAGAGAAAGCGIWATHFVSMLAYGTGLPIAFAPGLTILSAVIAIVLCAAGFAVAVERSGALGGIVTGIAIVLMHYIGMAAIEIPARAVWLPSTMLASVLIGVGFSGLALHIACRGRLTLGICLFAFAIVGMHFTAMSAVTFIPEGGHVPSPSGMDRFALGIVVTAGAAFIVTQGLLVALVDRYLALRAMGEQARMRQHIAALEETQRKLKQTSNELTRALGVAAEASQAKSAFLASMSHELRTPLNAILGFSESMMLGVFGEMGPRYRSYAQDIHNSGAHLLALINDVLDLSRLDAGQANLVEEAFDLAQLVGDCQRMMTGQAAKAGITLTADIAPGLPPLTADRRRIKQILLNLVSNAVKFTPEGGRVTVQAGRDGNGDLVLSVRDTGIGIAPEDIPKVMERFGQVDSHLSRKHEGTGLGLPLSRQLAKLHGGDLTLASVPDQGTTVTITLPAARLAAGPASVAATVAA